MGNNEYCKDTDTVDIIERWRTQHELTNAIETFVFYWANKNTGIHEISSPLLDDKEYLEDCAKLSHVLAEQMQLGHSTALQDFLGSVGVIEASNLSTKVTPENEALLAETMGYEDNEQYFPYSQCGEQAMTKMAMICADEKFSQLSNPLYDFDFVLEEPDPLLCAASIIQLFNKLEFLSIKYDKGIIPKTLNIVNIEVLTRVRGHQDYITKNMAHSDEVIAGLQNVDSTTYHTIH